MTQTTQRHTGRGAATRSRIVHAAIDCVIEDGYGGLTTTNVCERAGVSRGAYLHHLPTRRELVASVIEELASRLGRGLRGNETRLAAGTPGPDQVVDAIWEGFGSPDAVALLEVWIAARTDPDVNRLMEPMARRIETEVMRHCEHLFGPDNVAHPNYPVVRGITLTLLRGMLMERALVHFQELDQTQAELREAWKELAVSLLSRESR